MSAEAHMAAYNAALSVGRRLVLASTEPAPCPLSCLFPIGCVLKYKDHFRPVLDPDCRCLQTCNLRVHAPGGWGLFSQKATQVLQDAKTTVQGGTPSLLVLNEAGLVVVAEGKKDAFGQITWKDCHTFE